MSSEWFNTAEELCSRLSQECSTNGQWTDQHFMLAKLLMRKIHLLPPDWDDDVISRVAAKYREAYKARRTTNYIGWFHTLLFNEAVSIWRNESSIRNNKKEKVRRKEFVGMETVQLAKDDTDKHSKEWTDLLIRAMRPGEALSEDDLQMIAEHCCECLECEQLYRHQYVTIFIHANAVSATVRAVIGDFAWSRTVSSTPKFLARLVALTDWVAEQERLSAGPGLEYFVATRPVALFLKQMKRNVRTRPSDPEQPKAA